MRKALSIILSVALMATSIVAIPNKVSAAAGKVTLTIEKLSIGQGLYAGPTQVTINNGDTVKTVIDRYMNDHSLNYDYTTSSGWYLTSILGADSTRVAHIPNEIANIAEPYEFTDMDDYGLTHSGTPIYAPNTNQNLGNKDKNLGEGIMALCQVGFSQLITTQLTVEKHLTEKTV